MINNTTTKECTLIYTAKDIILGPKTKRILINSGAGEELLEIEEAMYVV